MCISPRIDVHVGKVGYLRWRALCRMGTGQDCPKFVVVSLYDIAMLWSSIEYNHLVSIFILLCFLSKLRKCWMSHRALIYRSGPFTLPHACFILQQ